jgi:hypothetical protein
VQNVEPSDDQPLTGILSNFSTDFSTGVLKMYAALLQKRTAALRAA